jgi:16S rRNA (cytosine1402-N4)-methyltransferase
MNSLIRMHKSVLLQEVVLGLAPQQGEVILDATVGGGGHSEALCTAVQGNARFVCLDEDEDALGRSRERLAGCDCEFLFYRTNFRDLDIALDSLGIQKVNRVLFDLGVSSEQLEESGRGFSFQRDEPLLMTMTKNPDEDTLTAARIVSEWDAENIETILRSYGEERAAKRIAQAIVAARAKKPILTSRSLAELIERTVRRRGRIHPATKTFQALRIAVNDEFRALQEALPKAWERLEKGGRLAVISFQSIEDRQVKRFFREKAKAGAGTRITKKMITPTRKEIAENPRARSAKLRIIEKT